MGKKSRSSWAQRPRAAIPYSLLDGPAFLEISHAARQAFWRLVVELGRHGGKENGRLKCTHRDFEVWGVPTNLVARAIRELVAVRLVEVTRAGAAGNADQRQAALYRLTFAPAVDREGADGTHDYERIATREEAAALVAAAAAPVNNRAAVLGRKGAAAAKIQNAALKSEGEAARKSEGETAKVPPSDLRAQVPPSDLRALYTFRSTGPLLKDGDAKPTTTATEAILSRTSPLTAPARLTSAVSASCGTSKVRLR